MKRIVFALFFTLLQSVNLLADDYKIGDIIRKDGIEYKVLVTYLVVDSKESPDTVKGPDRFYQAGELMVTKVNESLEDVIIPPAIDRYKVIGLTDSLFYNHTHNRIWLPDLMFAGNGCFAKLKMKSGALVVHGMDFLGMSVFDDLQGDLIFDTDRAIVWGSSFSKIGENSKFTKSRPWGLIKFNTKNMRFIKTSPVFDDCYTAQGRKYKRWIDQAFNNESEFQKNYQTDKKAYLTKKSFTTTPRKEKKGLTINSGACNAKQKDPKTGKTKPFAYPWGRLTQDFYRQSRYTVVNKKKRRNVVAYNDFEPVADATQKGGWYVKFVGDEGTVKYKLNGNLIKEKE